MRSANRKYGEGDVLIIRNEGPVGGPGMREMLGVTALIYGQGMGEKVALITDGRFFRRHPGHVHRLRLARIIHRRSAGAGARRATGSGSMPAPTAWI